MWHACAVSMISKDITLIALSEACVPCVDSVYSRSVRKAVVMYLIACVLSGSATSAVRYVTTHGRTHESGANCGTVLYAYARYERETPYRQGVIRSL